MFYSLSRRFAAYLLCRGKKWIAVHVKPQGEAPQPHYCAKNVTFYVICPPFHCHLSPWPTFWDDVPLLLIGTSGRVGCLCGSSAGEQISLLCCAHMRLTVTWHWLHISASVINEYRKCSSSKQLITGRTDSGITWQLKKRGGGGGWWH